jgi:hypothetical protein
LKYLTILRIRKYIDATPFFRTAGVNGKKGRDGIAQATAWSNLATRTAAGREMPVVT